MKVRTDEMDINLHNISPNLFSSNDMDKEKQRRMIQKIKKLFRLKIKNVGDEYDKEVCAASRCDSISHVIDATKNRWDCDVPLCERHWDYLMEEE